MDRVLGILKTKPDITKEQLDLIFQKLGSNWVRNNQPVVKATKEMLKSYVVKLSKIKRSLL